MKSGKVFGALVDLPLVIGACATATPEPTQAPTEVHVGPTELPELTATREPEPMEIVDTAVADRCFLTLVAAVQVTDMDD